jgi:LacI family transcriptional regulator
MSDNIFVRLIRNKDVVIVNTQGENMPITIHDIAEKAGVSHTTVSRVVNNLGNVRPVTMEKVESAIAELNYIPNAYARGLSQKKTNVIGVVVPEIRNPFFGEIIEGITSIADENDLNVLLFNTDECVLKEQRALRLLQEHRIRGLIITPATGDGTYNSEHLESFKHFKIPIILVDRVIPGSNLDGVFYDDIQSIYDATSALLDEGHRNIAVLGGNKQLQLAKNRVAGYIQAFESKGIAYDESNIYYGEFTKECAYNLTLELLERKNRPTAIVANNNMLSLGCLKALYEKKVQIPKDMAFIGYDRIEVLNIIQSNITIVEKQEYEYGQSAMQLLLKRLENPKMTIQKTIMSAKLVKRGSEKLIK